MFPMVSMVTFLLLLPTCCLAASATGQKSFRPLTSFDGSPVCTVDKASAVIPIFGSFAEYGIPAGVPDSVGCGYLCTGHVNCTSFNYRRPLTVGDSGRCELYTFTPHNCTTTETSCQHYGTIAYRSKCKPYADFDYIATTDSYYKPIFQWMSWGDATRKCLELSPDAHLVIINSSAEFQQVQAYLKAIPSTMSSKCIAPSVANLVWSGYWTAKRRANISVVQYTECMSTPFIWDTDNTTAGQLPAQGWESTMWVLGQPDCFTNFPSAGNWESCVNMPLNFNYGLNDVCCWYPQCPLCELDVE